MLNPNNEKQKNNGETYFDEKRGKIILGEDFLETEKECKQYLNNNNKNGVQPFKQKL